MLTCIPCSKQLNTTGSLREPPDDGASAPCATPSTKQAIKALTAQIKDMAVKASGAYKSCKPCSGSSSHDQSGAYVDSDAGLVSGRFYGSYRRTGSSISTPGLWGKEMEARLKALSSGSATPASVSGRTESVVFTEEDEPKEWIAQVEPGVLITFVSLPHGGNDLKRIRFRILILKGCCLDSLVGFGLSNCITMWWNSMGHNSKAQSIEGSLLTPPLRNERPPCHFRNPTGISYSSSDSLEHHPLQSRHSGALTSTPKLSSISAAKTETSSIDASALSSSPTEIDHSGELSASNASDLETEWVEQDEPGVYITIGLLLGGTRELRRVRFSRERFGEAQARLWWEENKTRIQQQYL
ncbi:hypothetical protein CDL12_12733 [Handroanthus impetiginosus]|uniref:BRX domain-containing protein n=1 Tax=Handroanthus impetiginosus TaxID=429701 RepID=A0A2G9HAV2_9LAMI|nr:hypothetical protein CDL12_12733 [Handroanthus impetiginosus]